MVKEKNSRHSVLSRGLHKHESTFNGSQPDSGNFLLSSPLTQVPCSLPHCFYLSEPGYRSLRATQCKGRLPGYGAGPTPLRVASLLSLSKRAWSSSQARAHHSASKALNRRVASLPQLCRQISQWWRCQTQQVSSLLETFLCSCSQRSCSLCSRRSLWCYSMLWIWRLMPSQHTCENSSGS